MKISLIISSEPFLVGSQLIAVAEEQETRAGLGAQGGEPYPAEALQLPWSPRECWSYI